MLLRVPKPDAYRPQIIQSYLANRVVYYLRPEFMFQPFTKYRLNGPYLSSERLEQVRKEKGRPQHPNTLVELLMPFYDHLYQHQSFTAKRRKALEVNERHVTPAGSTDVFTV